MNESHDQEERLLSRDQLETGSNNGENPAKNNSDSLKFCPLFIVSFLLLISLASNAIQSVYIKRLEKPQGCCASMYTGLRLDKAIPYELHNDYMNDNRNISDPLWAQLDSNPVAVALDRDFIRIHNLQQSTFCPRDHSKQLYQVKAFHHIHCLRSIRQAYFDALSASPDEEPSIPTVHVNHCLDMIRQDTMCSGDDTPTPNGHQNHAGNGEARKCKDWDALIKWTQAPERQSCF